METYSLNSQSQYAARAAFFRKVVVSLAILVAILSFSVLVGWMFDIPLLKGFSPQWVNMKANTAFCFVFAVWALLAMVRRKDNQVRYIPVGFILLIAVLTLFEYILGTDFGIDQLVFPETSPKDRTLPGRMSITTAINFILLSFAFIVFERRRALGQLLCVCVFVTALFSLIGYLYKSRALTGFENYSRMAVQGTISFLALSTAIMFSDVQRGFARLMLSNSSAGLLLRRLLPVIILAPIILGWLRLQGEYIGLYMHTEFGVALFGTMMIVVFSGVTWWTVILIDKEEGKRRQAEIKAEERKIELETTNNELQNYIAIVKESEEKFTRIFESNPIGISIVKLPESIISNTNRAFLEMIGYSSDEVIGKQSADLMMISQETRESIRKEVMATGSVRDMEVEAFKKNGEKISILMSLDHINMHGETVAIVISHDITDRKKSEEQIQRLNVELAKNLEQLNSVVAELEKTNSVLERSNMELGESEERFSRIFEASPVGISIASLPAGIIIEVNRSFLNMMGFTQEEVISHTSNELEMISAEERENIRQELLLKGHVRNLETKVRSKSGEMLPVLLSIDNFKMRGDHYGITIVHDISERKKSEEKIKQLNRELENNLEQLHAVVKELEAFSYSISHDLRAPLRAIDGYARMLEEDYKDTVDGEGKRFLNVIQSNAQKMGMLIDDLLAFSRLGKRDIVKSNIHMTELVNTCVSELEKSDRANADIKVSRLHDAMGDYGLLKQVITNLLSNALKYSAKAKKPVIEIKSEMLNEDVIYSISDNGAGFDMAYYNKLFGVFQRLHTEEEFSGTGVGLAIVQRIIQKHHGKVWAESKPGHGATFYFSLPLN